MNKNMFDPQVSNMPLLSKTFFPIDDPNRHLNRGETARNSTDPLKGYEIIGRNGQKIAFRDKVNKITILSVPGIPQLAKPLLFTEMLPYFQHCRVL
tara:strand:- start:43545 stop:43832 length:288 start_codon:yes stop_codon:yes gene_type:complete